MLCKERNSQVQRSVPCGLIASVVKRMWQPLCTGILCVCIRASVLTGKGPTGAFIFSRLVTEVSVFHYEEIYKISLLISLLLMPFHNRNTPVPYSNVTFVDISDIILLLILGWVTSVPAIVGRRASFDSCK